MKLLPPTGVPAVFEDESLRAGIVTLPGRRMLSLFNWGGEPQTTSVRLPGAWRIKDYWSDEDLGGRRDQITILDIPPHSARLLVATQPGV